MGMAKVQGFGRELFEDTDERKEKGGNQPGLVGKKDSKNGMDGGSNPDENH